MSSPERRLALAGALTGAGPGALRRRLDASEVVVRVHAAERPAATLAAAAVAAMAARLVGRVTVAPVPLRQPNPWSARTLVDVVTASRIGAASERAHARRIVVGVGAGGHDADDDIYLGGDDWTAVVSRDHPLGVGLCPLGGLGLQAAAALAVGEVVKELLQPAGMRCVPLDGELLWNLVDGRRAAAPGPSYPGEPMLAPRVAVLGSGSVGSSAVATLAMTALNGTVDVVDPDRFDPRRNAYRCPAVSAAERGPKAEWAARILRRAGWVAQAHRRTIAGWAAVRRDPGFGGIALVSVDTVGGRRDASDLLAATTVSAGVSGLAFHVHRHVAGDDLACPCCALVDIGRGERRLDPPDYATVALPSPDDVDPADQADKVSAPHVSWLAGTLLAAEVVKAAVGLSGLDRRVEIDLSGVPLGGLRRPPRDPSGRCPCTGPFRRHLARALYDR